jgi:ligand-binding sensor domain-containing protein
VTGPVQAAACATNGDCWIAGRSGISRLDESGAAIGFEWRGTPTEDSSIRRHILASGASDRVWLAVEGLGAVEFPARGDWRIWNMDSRPYGVVAVADGAYVAGESGVFRVDDGGVRNLSDAPVDSRNSLAVHGGKLWVASRSLGAISIGLIDGLIQGPISPPGANRQTWSPISVASGPAEVWFGTAQGELSRYDDDGNWTRFSGPADGLPAGAHRVQSLCVSSEYPWVAFDGLGSIGGYMSGDSFHRVTLDPSHTDVECDISRPTVWTTDNVIHRGPPSGRPTFAYGASRGSGQVDHAAQVAGGTWFGRNDRWIGFRENGGLYSVMPIPSLSFLNSGFIGEVSAHGTQAWFVGDHFSAEAAPHVVARITATASVTAWRATFPLPTILHLTSDVDGRPRANAIPGPVSVRIGPSHEFTDSERHDARRSRVDPAGGVVEVGDGGQILLDEGILDMSTGLPGAARDIALDERGTDWVATAGGGVQLADGRISTFTVENSGLPSNDVRAVEIDVLNRPIFATADGVAILDGGVLNRLAGGLPSASVRDLEIDLANTLWVATDAGLAKLVGQTFVTIAPTAGHRLDVVDSMPDGRTLAGGPDGLFVVHPSGAVEQLTFRDGLPATLVRDIYVAPPAAPGGEAEAWIATSGGLTLYVAEPEP